MPLVAYLYELLHLGSLVIWLLVGVSHWEALVEDW